jgi:tetratricopeptide (TPR) repeat protein
VSNLDLALEHLKAGEADQALKLALQELDDDPENRMAMMLAGRSFLDLKRPGPAEMHLKCAVDRDPNEPLLWAYLGLAYNMSDRPALASDAMRKALTLSPRYQLAMDAMVLIEVNQGNPDRAIRWANKSLTFRPEKELGYTTSDVLQNTSFAYLLRGDYKDGWPLYNLGVGKDSQRKERVFGAETRWDGTKGQTVVAYGEQGLGDEISFASAIPDLMKDCNVIIECDHRLEGLFARSFDCPVFGTRYRTSDWAKNFKIDARVSFAKLMEFYRNKKEDFPKTPYLKADPERRKWWRAILDQYPGKKIGVAWNGGTSMTRHRARSVDLDDMLRIRGKDTFVSLEYKDPGECGVLNFSRFINTRDYDDTAALVAELDHVISVTTAVVDLCGAIGKRCDVLVPLVPHWRFGLKGEMDWYESVSLFRQLPNEPWSKTIRRYARLHRHGQ